MQVKAACESSLPSATALADAQQSDSSPQGDRPHLPYPVIEADETGRFVRWVRDLHPVRLLYSLGFWALPSDLADTI